MISQIGGPLSRSRPPPPNIPPYIPNRVSSAASIAKKLATGMIRTSRLAMCERSCASRPPVRSMRTVRPASRPYALRFMRAIVVPLLLLTVGLNNASTACAADRCLRVGPHAGGAQGLVVARPGVDVVAAAERASEYAE